MKQLQSNFTNMVLSTTVVTLFAAAVLGPVYTATKEPIAQAKEQKKQQAITDVLPAHTRIAEAQEIGECTLYDAYNNDTFVGAAVESSTDGFGGQVKIMTGFDATGKIQNYSVIEQAETPGLGVKMIDWFKTDKNHQNILGKNPETDNLTVTKDGGSVDAITAATISSRAFLMAVNKAYAAFVDKHANANSSTTAQTDSAHAATPADTTTINVQP